MKIYQAIKELCLDLGFDLSYISNPDAPSDEDFEVLLREVNFESVRERINEDKYYKNKVRKSTANQIMMLEKLFIEDNWALMLTVFTEEDAGVNLEMRTFSVDYFTEEGSNINVETLGIAESLRSKELSDII